MSAPTNTPPQTDPWPVPYAGSEAPRNRTGLLVALVAGVVVVALILMGTVGLRLLGVTFFVSSAPVGVPMAGGGLAAGYESYHLPDPGRSLEDSANLFSKTDADAMLTMSGCHRG